MALFVVLLADVCQNVTDHRHFDEFVEIVLLDVTLTSFCMLVSVPIKRTRLFQQVLLFSAN